MGYRVPIYINSMFCHSGSSMTYSCGNGFDDSITNCGNFPSDAVSIPQQSKPVAIGNCDSCQCKIFDMDRFCPQCGAPILVEKTD